MRYLKRLILRYGPVMAADIIGLWFVRIVDVLERTGYSEEAVELREAMKESLS